jgi:hypothetical protein
LLFGLTVIQVFGVRGYGEVGNSNDQCSQLIRLGRVCSQRNEDNRLHRIHDPRNYHQLWRCSNRP